MCCNTHLVKKNPMGRFKPRHKVGEKFMLGEAASPTNPKKDRSGKRKKKCTYCLRNMSTGG